MMQREYDLVVRAVRYLTSHGIIPPDFNVDLHEREGLVDNVCFIINSSHLRGGILCPHNAVSDNVRIGNNNARVVNYYIMPYQSHTFRVSTLCHEMQHRLTFPDLYNYDNSHYRTPVSTWELMGIEMEERPQQSTAWAKYRYGTERYTKWIDEPELILEPDAYTLHSVGGKSKEKLACKIPTRDPDQFFIIEYRNKNDQFDKHPKSGVLIYRVDKRF